MPPAPKSTAPKNSAIALYLKKVKALSQVQSVAVEPAQGYTRVWTVISAPPFDFEARRPIYEAQKEILQQADEPLDFRLTNLEEIEADGQNSPPTTSEVLYRQTDS